MCQCLPICSRRMASGAAVQRYTRGLCPNGMVAVQASHLYTPILSGMPLMIRDLMDSRLPPGILLKALLLSAWQTFHSCCQAPVFQEVKSCSNNDFDITNFMIVMASMLPCREIESHVCLSQGVMKDDVPPLSSTLLKDHSETLRSAHAL